MTIRGRGNSDLQDLLRRHWGHQSFRPRQEQIVRSLVAGHDVIVSMPTGGGKSLCYQLPALISGCTAIVVSPLIALMQDQAAQLAQMGIPAAVLNSSIDLPEQSKIMSAAENGAYRLLYLSPERLARPDTIGWLQRVPLAFFVIDEAHCISEWGHDFRPEYRLLAALRRHFPDRPIAAFTASATQRVRHDILQQLQLREPDKYIASFDRPNLRYLVQQCKPGAQEQLLLKALRAHDGAHVIVYANTIQRVEDTITFLESNGTPAIGYHGQMGANARRRNQERWTSGEIPVLVGTLAFGLGINKPNVRAVIHLALPKSLEQYYQEAGRAGRDGLPADCALLWQAKDAGTLKYFIDQSNDPQEKKRAWQRYHEIRAFAESDRCRHHELCLHFGETPRWTACEMCDICAPPPNWLSRTGIPACPSASKKDQRLPRLAEQRQTSRPSRPQRPPRQARSSRLIADLDRDLFACLKQWRDSVAGRSKVPDYFVLRDTCLEDLCRRSPANLTELLEVSGINTQKAELYSCEILRILATYRSGPRATLL